MCCYAGLIFESGCSVKHFGQPSGYCKCAIQIKWTWINKRYYHWSTVLQPNF